MSAAPQPALLWSFNGSNVDSVTGLSPSLTTGTQTYQAGIYGQAALFNQTSSAGPPTSNIVYNISSLNLTANNLTFCSWINPLLPIPTASGLTTTFISLTDTQSDYSIDMNTGVSSTQPFVYNPINSNQILGGTYSTGKWFHNVITLSNVGQTGQNTLITYYFNGVSVGSLTITRASVSVINNLFCACYKGSGPTYCAIQDLRIYNTALSAAQIYGIYQSRGIPPRLTMTSNVAQPALLWSFNGSNVDSVTGLSPTFSTVNTSTQYAPTYVTGLYGQSIYLNNQTYVSGAPNCYVQYDRSPLTSLTTNNLSISFWVNLVSLSLPASSIRTMISFNETGSSQINYYTYYIYNNVVNYICQGAAAMSISSATAYAGQWFHNTIIFSNVGSTSSNTYTTLFINGISIGSANVGRYNTTSNLSLLQLGCAAGGGDPMWGSLQDLRIYNTALSASQIQGIYQSRGIPPRLTLTKGPTYPLAQTSIVSSALGLYSTRALVSTYTGPVVQVRRNSDNTTYNFIADIYGNLSNVQNSTSMAAFLSATTGNVATWYDQSGAGKHFTQATAVSQPQLVLNSGQWVLWFNRDVVGTPTFYASMTTASPITGVMTILYNYNMSTAFNSYTTLLGSNGLDNRGFRFNNLNVFGDAANRVGQDFLGTNGSYCYLNNSYGQMVNQTTGTRIGNQGSFTASVWNQVIGTQGIQSFSSDSFFNSLNAPDPNDGNVRQRPAYGYLSEMMLFSAPINSADAQTLWARTPLTNPLPTKTTSG